MNVHSYSEAARVSAQRFAWLLALALCASAACDGSDSPQPLSEGDAGATTGAASPSTRADAGADGSTSAGGAPTGNGGPSAGGSAGNGAPGANTTDAGNGVPSAIDAGQPVQGDASAQDAAQATADAAQADSSAPLQIPTPVTEPLVWGIGIGISDVPAAVKFYTEVMKLSVEKEGVRREDRTETVLYAAQASRGARLVLMNFDDKRNTRKITSKIVWQASDPGAVNSAASKYPDYVSRLNFGIVQFDGPETYIQEVGSIFDDGGSAIKVPYPIVIGFATSDLAASRRFYKGLGMTESSLGSFAVTDATGTGNITEYSLKWSTGSALVLQAWTPARNAKNNPVKAVLMVPDAKAVADKIVAGGGSLVKDAERSAVYDNRLLIVAKDPDGYLIELVQ